MIGRCLVVSSKCCPHLRNGGGVQPNWVRPPPESPFLCVNSQLAEKHLVNKVRKVLERKKWSKKKSRPKVVGVRIIWAAPRTAGQKTM